MAAIKALPGPEWIKQCPGHLLLLTKKGKCASASAGGSLLQPRPLWLDAAALGCSPAMAALSCRAPSHPTKMSCYDLCPPRSSAELCPVPRTSVAVPQPIAESCNELCARQCPDSSAFIQPPPVVVTFPGPILSSFPQQAVVGSSGAPAFGGSLGLGGLYGAGATQASGGLCTFGRAYAAPACSPCALPRYSKKLWDTCGPC
ncbi:LOW QUALITY PROTEIN: scale keratin-like [Ammospiza caudacuta]|uniref:LOW QUALITY PROTEIN: scale keratin-like n=3 Tax=Ammospiza caudacuta TaxID=2857398 RepID=UPI002738F796|nr:LOW QUALITY PROTEIN: scale keratin-like [Ammospiza caudacuta]